MKFSLKKAHVPKHVGDALGSANQLSNIGLTGGFADGIMFVLM
jgi:hypothetical protein